MTASEQQMVPAWWAKALAAALLATGGALGATATTATVAAPAGIETKLEALQSSVADVRERVIRLEVMAVARKGKE